MNRIPDSSERDPWYTRVPDGTFLALAALTILLTLCLAHLITN